MIYKTFFDTKILFSNMKTILSWTFQAYGPFELRKSLGPSILLPFTHVKVIRHVFTFGIEFHENKDIVIFGHFIVIDLSSGIATIRIFHLFQLPDFVDFELGVLSVTANDAYLWIIPYYQHCFLWNFVFYSRKAYLAHPYKKKCCTTHIHIELP